MLWHFKILFGYLRFMDIYYNYDNREGRTIMFNGKRFATRGITEEVPLALQVIMWNLIDTMDITKDYLQVFELSEENGKQKIIHSQEQPPYRKEYLFNTGTPFLNAKIFVIDDETHSTMLFNYEY